MVWDSVISLRQRLERKEREGKGKEWNGKEGTGMDLSYKLFGHRKCDPRKKTLVTVASTKFGVGDSAVDRPQRR